MCFCDYYVPTDILFGESLKISKAFINFMIRTNIIIIFLFDVLFPINFYIFHSYLFNSIRLQNGFKLK